MYRLGEIPKHCIVVSFCIYAKHMSTINLARSSVAEFIAKYDFIFLSMW